MIDPRRACVVLALVAVAHCLVPFGPLVFDDTHAVAENPAIRSLANVPAFFVDPGLFSSSIGRMYRPLVLTTLAIDHAIGGGAAWAFKLGNLLQHVAACALLLALLPRLLARAGLAGPVLRRATWVGTLLFGLHPLHVETLCLVSSRSEILAALGCLVALRGWLVHSGRPARQAVWLALGTAIACLAKETGVIVPPVVLLVELLLPASAPRRLADLLAASARAVPALAVAGVYLVLRRALFGVATMGLRPLVTGGDPLSGGSRDFATQIEAMAFFLPKSVFLWLVPGPLSLDHTVFYRLGTTAPSVLAGFAFVLGSCAAAVCLARRRPLVTLGVLGALAFALPWILVPLNVPLAEHRLYVPVLFLTLPAAGILASLGAGRTVRPWLVAAGLAVLPALLAGRSLWRQSDWLSLERVWASCLRVHPRSFRGWCGLADVEIERGNLWQAVRYLDRACNLYPRYAPAAQNRVEMRVRLMEESRSRSFHDRSLLLIETYAEERWKDPFARLLAARGRMAHYLVSRDRADLDAGLAWALSCLAMVDPKMLVYRTAAEVARRGGQPEAALALFEACEERGLCNDDLLLHKGEVLIAAGCYGEAAALVSRLEAGRPPDGAILALRARLAAALDDVSAWMQTCRLLGALGYDAAGLPRPPSLAPGASPNK